MSLSSLRILRLYKYDPLDRLTGVGFLQRFYQEGRLTTELNQQTQRTILRHQGQPLAQKQSEAGDTETTLLATDRANSLLQTVTGSNPQQFAYTAYGHHPAESALSRLPGFNGECPDDITGNYPLGQGNRFFNPVLMRFNSPDELSPFDEGGLNAYAYCENDPINFSDPTGNVKWASLIARYKSPRASVVVRPERSSVIVKPGSGPASTLQAASNVSSPISVKSNPILEGLLDQAPRNLQRPGTSQSIFPSRGKTPELPLALTGTKRTSQLNPNSAYRRKMAAVEREFDQRLKGNPNLPTFATPELSERLSKINKWLSRPETKGQQRNRLQQQKLDTIRKIKRDTLMQLNSTNKTIRK